MAASIVGFKVPKADLHRKSPKILLASIFVSIILVAIVVHIPLWQETNISQKVKTPPVIIHIENIPETRHAVRIPAPQLAIPLEVEDNIIPDDITIESTELDLNAVAGPQVPPAPPSAVIVPDVGVEAEEDEIFEYFSVEEQPKRINSVMPIYPEMAKRAGIEGMVYLKVLFTKTGVVDSVEVMKGSEIFHKTSIDAAKSAKFTPAKQNDRPVACWVIMPFKFILEN